MFRVNYENLVNCNTSCTLCGESNIGSPHLGRLITHSNNMNCAAHVNCVLDRLRDAKDLTCPTCNFPVNQPKILTEEKSQEKLQEHTFEQLNIEAPIAETVNSNQPTDDVDSELDAQIAQHLAAEVQFEDTKGDEEFAKNLQLEEEQKNTERLEREQLELEALQMQFGEDSQPTVLEDAERAHLEALQMQFNEEPEPQPRNPCLRQLTLTQAVWLAVAVMAIARFAMRF